MSPNTHPAIDPQLVGVPLALAEGEASAELRTTPEMAADARGLVHGGFVFGLADYAAMLAVNHPNVVLGAAETRFLAPVRVGETVVARAKRVEQSGRKHRVEVSVSVGEKVVMTGVFTTFVLEQHVLGEANP